MLSEMWIHVRGCQVNSNIKPTTAHHKGKCEPWHPSPVVEQGNFNLSFGYSPILSAVRECISVHI